MRTLAALLLGTSALALIGCGSNKPSSGGQIGGEGIGCLPVTTTALGMDDASPLGFSGSDVVAIAGGQHDGSLAWHKGGSTPLDVSFDVDPSTVKFLDREWTDDGSGAEMAGMGDCTDAIEVAGTLSFTTTDGALAESWPAKVLADTKDSAATVAELDLGAVQGSYQVTEVDPTKFDEVRVFLEVGFAAAGVHGKLFGQGTSCTSDDSEGVCSGEDFEVATF